MAIKLEDTCPLFKRMHILYDMRPNVTLFYEMDSTAITNTMPLEDSMQILVTNSPSLLLDLNLLLKKLLLEDTWKALLQVKFDEQEKLFKEDHNLLLSSISFWFLSISPTSSFIRLLLLGNIISVTSKKEDNYLYYKVQKKNFEEALYDG